ncbi:MAG TPA: hypothetical protein VKX17_09885 [Planctomycetota bacterium]|nr:hypothetical protein [Planctomycetota bacterium]
MPSELQIRAQKFLKRPIPKGMDYAPGSMAERFIATFAKKGRLEDDGEVSELLSLIVAESFATAQDRKGEEAAYFQESAEILSAIQETLE